MNQDSEIQEILKKFVLNQCNSIEIEKVVIYFKENKITDDFPTVEEVKKLLGKQFEIENSKADTIFETIISKSKEIESELRPEKIDYKKYLAIAASVILLFSIGWSYQRGFFSEETSSVLTGNEITLQLANGDIQIISENSTATVYDSDGKIIGKQNGNSIVYDAKTGIEKLVYNTLKIPYGKRFQIKLSDGTTVHLNAGTTLKYPVKFVKGQIRNVYLDGEAYFDVSSDKKHPFVVNADDLNIKVLGTHFNVANYPEDNLTDVVLVEGSVGLYSKNTSFDVAANTILKPGEKGSFIKNSKHIETRSVDPEIYTSWMKGTLTFKNMPFKNITKKLERHYDVVISIDNTKLAEEKFSATFKDQSIAKVLSYFSEVQGFNYTVNNKDITIK